MMKTQLSAGSAARIVCDWCATYAVSATPPASSVAREGVMTRANREAHIYYVEEVVEIRFVWRLPHASKREEYVVSGF